MRKHSKNKYVPDAVYSANVLHSLEHPYKNLDPTWQIKRIISYNIKATQFETAPELWSSFRSDATSEPIRRISFMFSAAIEEISIGSEQNSFTFGNAIPKVVPIVEKLLSETLQFEGFRVWLFQLDPNFKIDQVIKLVMEKNREINLKKTTKGAKIPDVKGHECYMTIDSKQEWASCLGVYYSQLHNDLNFDQFGRDDLAVDNPDSPINPYSFFLPSSAILECPLTVRPLQSTISNYFDQHDGVAGQGAIFKGFPDENCAYRYYSYMFTPLNIYYAPLPDQICSKFLNTVKDLDKKAIEIQAKAVEIKIRGAQLKERIKVTYNLDTLDAVREWSTNALKEMADSDETTQKTEIEQALFDLDREYKSNSHDEDAVIYEMASLPSKNIAAMHQLIGSLDSDAGKLLLNGAALEKHFAKKNDFIKLGINNRKILEEMDDRQKTEICLLNKLKSQYFDDYDEYAEKRRKLKEHHLKNKDESILYHREKANLREYMCTDADKYVSKRNALKLNYYTKEYPRLKKEFTEKALVECWTIFNESNNVTDPIFNLREFFKGLSVEDHFADLPQIYQNLSPTGNMITRLSQMLEVKRIKEQYAVSMLVLFNIMCTYHYQTGIKARSTLKPNFLITAGGGAGKSYAVQTASDLAAPGTIFFANHITPKALTSEKDQSDVHLMTEETPHSFLGVGPDGKACPVDPLLKSKMTEGRITTMSLEFDENGSRTSKVYVSRNNSNMTGCSNISIKEEQGGPLRSRYITWLMKSLFMDRGLSECDSQISTPLENMEGLTNKMVHGWQMTHFYLVFWEQCITAGALPDINVTEVEFTMELILNFLVKKGIEKPSERQKSMTKELARAICMMSAIQIQFFGELGLSHRIDPRTELPKRFDPIIMAELIKWSVVTEEQTIFIMSLLQTMWIPYSKNDVAQSIGKGLNVWPPTVERDYLDKGTNFYIKNPERASFESPVYDLRYVSITGKTRADLIKRILENMTDKISPEDLGTLLNDMLCDTVPSQPMEFYDQEEYEIKKMEYDIKKIEYSIELTQTEITEKTVEADNIDTKMKDAISFGRLPKDVDKIQHNTLQSDLIELRQEKSDMIKLKEDMEVKYGKKVSANKGSGKSDVIQKMSRLISNEDSCDSMGSESDNNGTNDLQKRKKVLRPVIGSKTEKIPLLVVDWGSKGRREYTIAIAISSVSVDLSNLMSEAIKSVEHKFHPEKTYLTGTHYSRINRRTGKKENFYNIFETVKLKSTEKILTIGNKFHMDNFDRAIFKEIYNIELPDTEFRPFSVLNDHSESITFRNYWMKNDLPQTEHTEVPLYASEYCWFIREHHSHYKNKKKSIGIYPDTKLEQINIQREELRNSRKKGSTEKLLADKKYLYSDSLVNTKGPVYRELKTNLSGLNRKLGVGLSNETLDVLQRLTGKRKYAPNPEIEYQMEIDDTANKNKKPKKKIKSRVEMIE